MTAEIANMLTETAHNLTLGAIFMIGTSLLNIVGMGFLVYGARLNLKTARMLAEIARDCPRHQP